MRNFLISLRTKATLLVGSASAGFLGTIGFHATAERQTRLEFVRDLQGHIGKLIAIQQNPAIEYAQLFLEALIRTQNRTFKTLFGGQRSARACEQRTIPPIPAFCHLAVFC